MRLHRLAMTAFGPFAGSEEVDLDALAASGLFLIHGPTGAGKSSILDAICFALYAAVPGARSGGRVRLRSDHAGPGVVPEVTLDFTAAGRRLRVCRSPEFSRPKKRGIGDTTVPARVVLDELVGSEWVNRGTRNDEVALVLRDIVGMGLDQFVKVVLLPQGDFAAFLRASPEERRSVLEKLFDTQRFTEVESWLGGRRRQSAAAADTARVALSTGLVRVDDVIARLDQGDDIVAPNWSYVLRPGHQPGSGSGTGPGVIDPSPGLIDESPDVEAVLAGLVAAVDLRASTALAGVEVARSTVISVESAVNHGKAVAGHQETAAAAQVRLDELDQQRGACQDAADRVDLAERAGAVSGFVAAVRSATLTREAALAKVADLRKKLRLVGDVRLVGDLRPVGDVRLDVDASMVRSLIGQVAGHSDALQQIHSQADQAQDLADESARHSDVALIADRECLALTRQGAEVETGRLVAERSRDAGRAALAKIPELEARHKTLGRIHQLLDDQERSAAGLETLQQQADSAKRVLLDARERLLDLRERRLAGLSAELAGGLVAGDSCPVCGSSVHPMPAITLDLVRPVDIQSAEDDQTRAAETLNVLTSKVSAEVARRDIRALELAAHLNGLPDAPTMAAADVRDALAEGAVTIAEARTTASTLPEAVAQLTALALDGERTRSQIAESAAARASSLALATSTREQSRAASAKVTMLLADHGVTCPCLRGEPTTVTAISDGSDLSKELPVSDPVHAAKLIDVTKTTDVTKARDVSTVISRHFQTLDDLRSLAAGLQDLGTHEATALAAGRRLSAALKANGLGSMAEAEAATLSPAEVTALRMVLRTTDHQRAQAVALLAQPDVAAALELPAPDLDALAEVHRQAAALLTEAGRRHTLSEQAQRELQALSGIVHQALGDLGPAQEEAQLVQRMADCFAGNSADNALRMRLSSYVLSARLAEIATLANERLATMSDGRYTLEYTDARAAKGARSGLGLLVRDAWTGQPRETSSLSGGEAFMASLALALGLGDAVRAEAGGFDLQTLFVDEGFGSLDEESLEQVMAVLDTLREGGRAVGIVSHVTELRTRIPHQLHVLKQQGGSRITVDAGATSVA